MDRNLEGQKDRCTRGLPEVHAPTVSDQNILALEGGLEGQAQRHLALGGALEEQLGAGHQQRQLDDAGVLWAVPCGPLQQVGRILWWAIDIRQPKCTGTSLVPESQVLAVGLRHAIPDE